MHVQLKCRAEGDVHEQFRDTARVGRRAEVVLAFRNVFGDLDRVVANRSECRRQLLPP